MLTAELNRTRRMGVEHEFTMPLIGVGSGLDVQRTVANVLTANGVRAVARGYSHDPVPPGYDIAVESDSSVRGESRWSGITWMPIEMKTRILDGVDDWERVVPKALEIVKYLGARVNTSTGHHVHLSMPEAQTAPRCVRSLYNVFHKFENVIFGMLAPSRKGNTYCAQIPATNEKLLQKCKSLDCFRRALTGANLNSRYLAVNFTHLFDGAPRIEFRHHHGTLDVEKSRNWLRALLQLMQHAATRTCQASEQLPNDRQSLERLLTSCGFKSVSGIYAVSEELRETGRFLLKRWKGFNGQIGLNSGTSADVRPCIGSESEA